ncbi:MAG: helix-turn-helix domain-containing protein [Bacteroides sp.]|nr:helix-turn-helix domain-containing protein [Bacteroides sp.]MCM1413727.1 helix-turn-helix domain-containing protein [Bacteroides sp.]MCM1471906.1 helix-turn-helix domain-containing protein [Bacteroides sp.]
MAMKLLIKNMVCRHCVETCQRTLSAIDGVDVEAVDLGYALIRGDLLESKLYEVRQALENEGFELIKSREAETVETIKRLLIDLVWHSEPENHEPVSEYLSHSMAMSYAVLSRTFSALEGRTIEKYLTTLRVERVKELILHFRMTMSEIADEAGYSSVAHMSRMFKQVTGMTPSDFRSLGQRRSLAEI